MTKNLPGDLELNRIFRDLAETFYPSRRIDYRVEWSGRMSRSAGLCYYKARVIRLSTTYHAAWPSEIANTLRHELIHASGIRRHDGDFRGEAARLGCDIHARAMPRRPFRYVYACLTCGRQVKTRRRVDLSCGGCSKRWDPRFRLQLIGDLKGCEVLSRQEPARSLVQK